MRSNQFLYISLGLIGPSFWFIRPRFRDHFCPYYCAPCLDPFRLIILPCSARLHGPIRPIYLGRYDWASPFGPFDTSLGSHWAYSHYHWDHNGAAQHEAGHFHCASGPFCLIPIAGAHFGSYQWALLGIKWGPLTWVI